VAALTGRVLPDAACVCVGCAAVRAAGALLAAHAWALAASPQAVACMRGSREPYRL